jgi:hypothetical protein
LGALLFVSPSPSALAKGADKERANKSEEQKRDEAKADDQKSVREDKGEGEGERVNDGRNEGEDEDEGYDGRYYRDRYRYGYGYYYEEPTDSSHFVARMSGDQEVPKKGAPGGRGLARLDVDPYEHRVCYQLSHEGIGKPTAAHIHRGGPGESGPAVVDFDIARNGDHSCVTGNPRVLRDMQAQPQHYYVNIHTAEFPDGAIRGQVDYPT